MDVQRPVPIIMAASARPLPLVLVPPPPVPEVPETTAIVAVLAGAPVLVAGDFMDSDEISCCLDAGVVMELVAPPPLGNVDDDVGNGSESGASDCCCCCGCDDSGRDRGSNVDGIDDMLVVLWSERDNAIDEGTGGPGVETGGGIQSDT